MSERRPGLDLELVFDPDHYAGADIPDSLVADLMAWCAERGLFGGCTRTQYDENGDKEKPRGKA